MFRWIMLYWVIFLLSLYCLITISCKGYVHALFFMLRIFEYLRVTSAGELYGAAMFALLAVIPR